MSGKETTELSGLSDRFEILSEVGAGASGSVFHAYDQILQRDVCIKILHAIDTSKIARFQREAQAASKLKHSNLVSVMDFGIDSKNKPYLVMEFIDGKTLKEVLRVEKKLSVERTVTLFSQLCRALSHAHDKGVLHRDLKPGNVIIKSMDNGEEQLKIVDFGLAKFDGNQSLTTPGVAMGTPHYVSPEAVLGKEADPRSDIYGLGCVIFECLTGFPPFSGGTASDTMLKHVNEPVPAITDSTVPEKLKKIVSKCLAKDPNERFQTIDQLRLALSDELHAAASAVPSEDNESKHIPIHPRLDIAAQLQPALDPKLKKGRMRLGVSVAAILMIGMAIILYSIQATWQLDKEPLANSVVQPRVEQKPSLPPPTGMNPTNLFSKGGNNKLRLKDPNLSAKETTAIIDRELGTTNKRLKKLFVDAYNIDESGIAALVANCPNLEHLTIAHSHLSKKSLKLLATLPYLTDLYLIENYMTDDQVTAFATMPKLYRLYLQNQNITDSSLNALAELKGLAVLSLYNDRQVTGIGLSRLFKSKNLERLDLTRSGVQPKYISSFLKQAKTKLKRFKNIGLGALKLTDADIKTMDFSQLKTLELAEDPITDASMKHIDKFPNIQHLHLGSCNLLTDKGLFPLTQMHLKTLDLKMTNISTLEAVGKLNTLKWLKLNQCAITDDSLKQLVDMELDILEISQTPVSDKGLEYIKKMKGVRAGRKLKLNFAQSRITSEATFELESSFKNIEMSSLK